MGILLVVVIMQGEENVLFVGLGPRGNEVSAEALRTVISEHAEVSRITHKGHFALVDLPSSEAVQAVAAALQGTYIGTVRLAARASVAQRAVGNTPRYGTRGRGLHRTASSQEELPVTSNTVFVGLGPQGHTVSEDQLRAHLQLHDSQAATFRMHGAFAIVQLDTAESAASLIHHFDGSSIGDVRLRIREDRPVVEGRHGGNRRHHRPQDSSSNGCAAIVATKLVVNLGPKGASVTVQALTQLIEALSGPVVQGCRRTEHSVIVALHDPHAASRVMDSIQGRVISGCRIAVRPWVE